LLFGLTSPPSRIDQQIMGKVTIQGFQEGAQGIHKALLSFAIVTFCAGLILMIIGGIINPLPSSAYSNSANFSAASVVDTLFRSLAFAAGVPLIITSIFGICGIIFWVRGLAIVHIVFSALMIPLNLVTALFPLVFSAILSLFCSALNDDCTECSTNTSCPGYSNGTFIIINPNSTDSCYYTPETYDTMCVDWLRDVLALEIIMFMAVVICFVASILGCVGCSSIKSSHYSGPI